ncbi:polysaccharide deacetylase family protein [Clostridium saccharoperbutylacetonicum]|uniref:polysaccharide deacetylase family protein n=1 Tax=Clostridium saccharoperbutylacetonicum TaxID=36745 RepID=UPI0039EC274B
MKFDRRNNNKMKNIKRARTTILFIIVAIFVIVGSALAAQKFSSSRQAVQAFDEVRDDKNQKTDSSSNQEDKNSSTETSPTKESNSGVEDVAFVEKYLNQQMKGQKPDGADGKKVAYLTFDDGPSETVTPQILDILKAENVHATFFLVGKEIDASEANKNLVKREYAEGNAIGNHTYTHDYNYLYPKNKINVNTCMSDFEKTNQSLKNVLGQDFSTRAVRFPGGQMTWEKSDPQGIVAMDKALHDKDYHQIDWNALSGDAESKAKRTAEQLTQEAIKTIGKREKVIILMHDTYGKEETAKALPGIIKYLKDQGYEFKILK